MEMRLPQEVLEWVDANRGHLSRQVFIISTLSSLITKSEYYNTKELIYEAKLSTKSGKHRICQTNQ
jgi:hypothetical protein